MKLTLPKNNMTSGKYRTACKTEQVCVIPATDENRKAIQHLNKLAREQNSKYRFKVRNRSPKEGVKYGRYGGVDPEDATGLGIYISMDPKKREENRC